MDDPSHGRNINAGVVVAVDARNPPRDAQNMRAQHRRRASPPRRARARRVPRPHCTSAPDGFAVTVGAPLTRVPPSAPKPQIERLRARDAHERRDRFRRFAQVRRAAIAREREHEGGDAVVETLDEDFLDEGFRARARDVDESDDEGAEDEDDEAVEAARENIFGSGTNGSITAGIRAEAR